jgi:hypothetical protein
MALPKKIQQQVEAADELVAQLSGDETGDQQGNPEVPPEVPPETSNNNEQPPDPPPVEPESKTVSQEPPAVPESKWENKYHTLKGMYDAEVPRLHADLREMKAQMQQLLADKAEAEAKLAAKPEPQKSLITEQDKEAFGPDLIDLIERATESKVSTFREREVELVNEIKQLKSQLGNVSERQVVSDKDRFLMGLSQQVPTWEQLNTDPGFLEWLQQVDPVYGLPRQAALTNAYEVFDVNRVAAIFRAYIELTAPKQTQATPKQDLQRQVAPTRSRASTPPAADVQNSKIYTQGEIEQFYNEWRRGYIENDEAVRMEKEIIAAISQGRVR